MAKIVQGERNGKLSLLKFDNAEPPPVLWKDSANRAQYKKTCLHVFCIAEVPPILSKDSANYVEPTYHGGLVHIFLDKKTKKHTFF